MKRISTTLILGLTASILVGCGGGGGIGNGGSFEKPIDNGDGTSTGRRVPLIMKSGQTKSYIKGDDGYYQLGLYRKYTRDDSSGVVLDKTTKLEWQDTPEVLTNEQRWEDSRIYCKLLEGGKEGWRLPTTLELMTIADYSRSTPALNPVFKHVEEGNSTKPRYYWASGVPDKIKWVFDVNTGLFSPDRIGWRTSKAFVRCVKGGSYSINSPLTRDENREVVVDMETNLMWQDNDDGIVNTQLSWESSIKYCESLELAGFEDWRLPSINELRSLRNYADEYPSIREGFIHHGRGSYWSSTTQHFNENEAWYDNFTRNIITNFWNGKEAIRNVRCVR